MAIDLTPAATSVGSGASSTAGSSAEGESGNESRTASKTNSSGRKSASSAPDAAGNKSLSDGMTREDELFRMKWGWAAFDAARSAALREANASGGK